MSDSNFDLRCNYSVVFRGVRIGDKSHVRLCIRRGRSSVCPPAGVPASFITAATGRIYVKNVTLQVHCLSPWFSPHPGLIVTHLAFHGYYGLWFNNTRVSMVTIAIKLWVTSQPMFPRLWSVCEWHQNLGSHGHYRAWFVSDVTTCFHDYDRFVSGIRTWDLIVTIELSLWVTSQPVSTIMIGLW
jgi:hypothetical protein